MNSGVPRFIRIGDQVRGPFTCEQLRQLAEVEVITPATEVAESKEGPWSKIELCADALLIFPPKREFKFKATSFEAVNPPRPDLPQQGNPEPPQDPTKAVPPNDVEQMVTEVAVHDAAHAPPMVFPKKIWVSRRFKLLVVAVIVGNALIAALPFAYDGRYDEMTMAILGSWIIIYTTGLILLVLQMPEAK